MKTSYQTFKLMLLRPAVYNGEEIEIDVRFDNDFLHHTDISEAEVIDMKPGDTVSIRGKICFDDEDSSCEYITIYMSEDILTEFIDNFGFGKITAAIRMRVKFIYAVQNNKDFCFEEKKEEIIACKLLEIFAA